MSCLPYVHLYIITVTFIDLSFEENRICLRIATVGPPLWSSGQSSWLQIQRPGFDSQHYQIFLGEKKENSSGSGTGSTQPREYN
jgi:hypothetical protein